MVLGATKAQIFGLSGGRRSRRHRARRRPAPRVHGWVRLQRDCWPPLAGGSIGNVTTGIVVLASQRERTRGAPITSVSFAGFALLAALLAMPFLGGAVFLFVVVLAAPVAILLGMGLARETNGA